jgi:nucleoside-diphosphate-sugar epimerase
MDFSDVERVVILGGAGFIGTRLGLALMERGCIVSSVDTAYDPNNIKYGQYIKPYKNLLDESTMIIHLASIVGVANVEQDPMGTIETTYQTVKDIIPYCDGTRKVLYASTSEVCADGDLTAEWNPIKVDNIDNIRSSYKLVKLLAENMILSNGGIVIRPFNITGVGQTIEKAVIPKMVHDALTTGVIKIYGTGGQIRSFMSIDDAITAIIHVLDTHDNADIKSGKIKNAIYNIGNERNEATMSDIAWIIQEKLNPRPTIEKIPFSEVYPKSIDIDTRVPTTDKVGIRFDFNLDKIIDEIIEDQINEK